VAACFFGDGAANQGVLMETLNVAAIWGLPMIFVCENNTFSEFTPSREITAGRIGDRARAFDIPTHEVDGNDVVAVWRSAGELIAHARAGGGPSFLMANTYRIHGHMERERFILGEGRYRDDDEIAEWNAKDPIDRLAGRLVAQGIADETALAELDARLLTLVDAAEAAADAGEAADPTLAERVMFAGAEL
jgi:acetoin:2,6-dichlorophenolindophenol oxidoreductase subunit alpha